jgi:hypothetical protein
MMTLSSFRPIGTARRVDHVRQLAATHQTKTDIGFPTPAERAELGKAGMTPLV